MHMSSTHTRLTVFAFIQMCACLSAFIACTYLYFQLFSLDVNQLKSTGDTEMSIFVFVNGHSFNFIFSHNFSSEYSE